LVNDHTGRKSPEKAAVPILSPVITVGATVVMLDRAICGAAWVLATAAMRIAVVRWEKYIMARC